MKIRIFVSGCVFLLIVACAPTSKLTRDNASKVPTAYETGAVAYDQYLKAHNPLFLAVALKYLTMAIAESPDNVFVQKMHYSALYETNLLRLIQRKEGVAVSYDSLYEQYDRLHPAIKAEVLPPTRLRYAESYIDKENEWEQMQYLQQMIKDQPATASNWYSLSQHFNENKKAWLSLAAAQRAYTLNPDNHKILFRLGEAYNDVAESDICVYSEADYLKKSALYLSKAATKEKEAIYFRFASFQYQRLGLFPLSFQQAKQAWTIKNDKDNSERFVEAAFTAGQYQDAVKIATDMANNISAVKGYKYLLYINMAMGDLTAAKQWLNKYKATQHAKKTTSTGVLDELQLRWIEALLTNKKIEIPEAPDKTENPWYAQIFKYIGRDEIAAKSLVDIAENGCAETEAYFYEAFSKWLEGDSVASKRLLQKAAKSPATMFSEYSSARAILGSGLLEDSSAADI